MHPELVVPFVFFHPSFHRGDEENTGARKEEE
jgi:hypothetical protein